MINKKKIVFETALFGGILFLLLYILPVKYIFLVYIIQIIFFLAKLLKYKDIYVFDVLSPCGITLIYLLFNFGLGTLTNFDSDIFIKSGLNKMCDLTDDETRKANMFFIVCNIVVFIVFIINLVQKDYQSVLKKNDFRLEDIIILLALIVLFSLIKVDLRLIGGKGDFSTVFIVATYVIFAQIISVSDYGINRKIIIYTFTIAILIPNHYDSKREILYPIYIIILYESIRNRVVLTINIRKIAIGLLIALFLTYIIALCSVLRGYNSYENNGFVSIFKNTNDYIASGALVNNSGSNFEFAGVYGQSVLAIHYSDTEEIPLLYGSTIIKSLYILDIFSIVKNKPKSMINIYTTTHDPLFRDRGGSFPITVYAEMYCNFHWIGFFILFLLYSCFEKVFNIMKTKINNKEQNTLTNLGIVFFTFFIAYVRGSGFDIILTYALVSFPLLYIINVLLIKKRKGSAPYLDQ